MALRKSDTELKSLFGQLRGEFFERFSVSCSEQLAEAFWQTEFIGDDAGKLGTVLMSSFFESAENRIPVERMQIADLYHAARRCIFRYIKNGRTRQVAVCKEQAAGVRGFFSAVFPYRDFGVFERYAGKLTVWVVFYLDR